MDPVNQGINPDASLLPVKRKRGRPRKDPSEKKQPRRARPQVARLPPGFGLLNSNRPPQVEPINNTTEKMIGRTVTGVVEATFDAGYMLAVKIGNSNTILRGVVFKPGHSAPVTAENDVVPHIPMIRRNEIYFSTESQAPPRRRKRRSRENNMQLVTYTGNEIPPVNQVLTGSPSKGVLAPSVPPVGARGTVVPVVLQPVSLSNGLSNNQPAPNLRDLQGKPVHTVQPLAAVYPLNESTSQAFGSQTSSQVTPMGSANENGPFKQGIPNLQHESNDVRPQGETPANQDRDTADMEEPLFIEPLRTRHHFQPAPPVARAVEHIGAGRMSELLQAVQQNMGDVQVPRNGHPTAGSM